VKKYSIKYTHEAKKNIGKLDRSIKQIVKKAIESLSVNPFRGKPLAYDLSGLYSFRTSDYRIIYHIRDEEILVVVIAVGHRKDIYKKLKKLLD